MRRKTFALFTIVFVILDLVSLNVNALEAFAFDWDDNLLVMVPEIVLINNKTNEEITVSTKEWATLRHDTGEGKSYRRKPEDDATIDQVFLDKFKQTLELAPSKWQAPMWKSFTHALEDKQRAAQTAIITGRRNSREVIATALKILKERGFIKNVPTIEKIFPVSNKVLFPSNGNVAQIKVDVIASLLDSLNAVPLDTSGELHTWNFSDDDPENFERARDFLVTQIRQGRWPNVKISVTFST